VILLQVQVNLAPELRNRTFTREDPMIPPRMIAIAFISQLLSQSLALGQELPPVTGATMLAITEQVYFPYVGANAVIVRRTTLEPHDVIVVRAGRSTPKLLAEAVSQLGGIRALYGNTPAGDAIYRVTESSKVRQHEGYAVNWNSMLRAIRPSELAGFGVVRHVSIYLRDQQPQRSRLLRTSGRQR